MQIKEALNIYVVEASHISNQSIEKMVKSIGHLVVGKAERPSEAFIPISNLPVDLVLLEINLQGRTDGIGLANQIKEHLNIPLIYITSYDDCGLMEQMITTDPSGYIMKPYTKSLLKATISIAYSKFTQQKQALITATTVQSKINYVLVSEGALRVKLAFDKVLFIESDGNYVEYHTHHKVYRERSKLKEVEEIVSFQSFVRVNKGLLINLSKATGFSQEHVFIGDRSFPVSRLHRKNIKEYFRL